MVALHAPRHCLAWERFFPEPLPLDTAVPLDITTVKLHLSGCLARARHASFEDAWRELKLGHWVWYNEGYMYAEHSQCTMAKAMRFAPWPKAREMSFTWAKPKAPLKTLRKSKAKAKAKARTNILPQVIAQPHANLGN